MRYLPNLFANNRAWAAARRAADPGFFDRLAAIQRPAYLWLGCADSRVPANEIVGLDPGELFVHRNVANILRPGDVNALSVIQYAVDTLQVGHVIVCGHYGCGGVLAAMGPPVSEPLESWLGPLRAVYRDHREELDRLEAGDARWRRLCELNVMAQVEALARVTTVTDAWARGQPLVLHGWIYDVGDGLLRDLEVTAAGP